MLFHHPPHHHVLLLHCCISGAIQLISTALLKIEVGVLLESKSNVSNVSL